MALGEQGDARRRRDPGFLRSRRAARHEKGKGDEAKDEKAKGGDRKAEGNKAVEAKPDSGDSNE